MNRSIVLTVFLALVFSGCAGFPPTAIAPTFEGVVKLIGALAPPKKEVQETVGPIRLAAIEKKRAGVRQPYLAVSRLEGLHRAIEMDLKFCTDVERSYSGIGNRPAWYHKICDHRKEYEVFRNLANGDEFKQLTEQLRISRTPAVEAKQLVELIAERRLAEFKRSGLQYEKVTHYYIVLTLLSAIGTETKTEVFQHAYAGLAEFPDDWNLNGFLADFLLAFNNDPVTGIRHMERILVVAEQGIGLVDRAGIPEAKARFELIRAFGLHQLAYHWAEAEPEGRVGESGELTARSASERAVKFIESYDGANKSQIEPIFRHSHALVRLRFARSVEDIERTMPFFQKAAELAMTDAVRTGDFTLVYEVELHHKEARKILEEMVKQGLKSTQPESAPKQPAAPQGKK